MNAEELVEYNYVLTQPDSASGEIKNDIKNEAELEHKTENTNVLSSKINGKGDSADICNDGAIQNEGNSEEKMITDNEVQAELGDDGQEDSAETSDYNLDNDTETDENYDYQNLLHSKQDDSLVSDESSSIPKRHSTKSGKKNMELNAKTNVSKLNTLKVKSELDIDTNTIVLNRFSKFKTRTKLDPSQMRHFCDRCDEGFKFPYQLSRHVEVKHEGKYPYSCKICGKSFDRISSQRDHMLVHTDLRPFECKVCKKKFKMNGNLRKHVRDIHEADAGPKLQFQCEYCSKIFPTKERLLSHFIVHDTEKAFECNICGKRFNRKNNLKEHLITHSSEKNYKCPDCHMCFNRPYSLKIHARNHLAVKPYKCELCPSSFSQLHALKTHFRLHTGEKPFKCSICQRSFRQQATLQVHFKRHTGVKDYVCKVCGRGFVIKRRLIEHERMHTGEKPFSCDLCPYTAATSSGMRIHKKTHLRQIARQALKQVEQLEQANAGTENNTGDQVNPDNSPSLTSTAAGRASKQEDTNRHNKTKKGRLSNENKAPKMNVSTRFLRKKKKDFTKNAEKDSELSENDNEYDDDDLSVEEEENSISIDDEIVAKSNRTYDMIEIVNDHEHSDKLDDSDGKIEPGSGVDNADEEITHHTDSTSVIEKTDIKEAEETKVADDDSLKLVDLNQEQSFVIEETGLNLQTVGSKPKRGGSRKRKAKLNNIDKSSMREILYKHLNEFIPVIDGDLLAEKIDLITQEFMEHFQQQNTPAKEISNVQKVMKAKRPSKKTGGKSVNSSLNWSNSDLSVESDQFANSLPKTEIIPTSQLGNPHTTVTTFSRTPNVNIPHTGTTTTMYDDYHLTRSTPASNSLLITALMAANNKGLFTPTVTGSTSIPQSALPSTVICSPPIMIKKEPGLDSTNPEKSFFSNKLRDMLQSKPLDLPITNSFNITSPANGSVLQPAVQTAQKSSVSNSSSQKSSAVLRSMLSTPPKHYLLATKNSFNTSLVSRQLRENHCFPRNASRGRAKASDFPWVEEPQQEPEAQNPPWVAQPSISAVHPMTSEITFNMVNIKAEPKSP